MKNTFSRLFGLGADRTEQEPEVAMEPVVEQSERAEEEIQQIALAQIVPNRFQPRTIFHEEKIKDLAVTISEHGIIQPIVLRPTEEEGRYEIIAGERRFRAVTMLGWETIPAIIKQYDDKQTASIALIENLQREELTPIEEALAYEQLLQLHELTQEQLAQKVGKGQSTVANKLRLLKLPEDVQQALLEKTITERHARALLSLKESDLQLQVLAEIVAKQWNVKQTEERIQQLMAPKQAKAKPRFKAISKDVRIAVNTIRQSLKMVNDSGMGVEAVEEDFDQYYQITIQIPKKK